MLQLNHLTLPLAQRAERLFYVAKRKRRQLLGTYQNSEGRAVIILALVVLWICHLTSFVNPTLRKFNLTMHVGVSVGWLGAVLAYLPFAIRSMRHSDPEAARTLYEAMNTIGWGVIVPCAFGALVTGLIQSLGTPLGLFRYYWILAKFVLTVGGITILLMHMPLVSRLTQAVQEGGIVVAGSGKPLLVHATGGLVILGLALILSVFKPWGLTAYGRSKLHSEYFSSAIEVGGEMLSAKRSVNPKIWAAIAILLGIGAVVGFAVLYHLRGGMPSH